VAIKCANCGQVLPRGNARFCNKCGAPTFSEEDIIFPDESTVFPEDSIEDLPTAQLEANIPEPPTQERAGPARASSTWDANLSDVAQLPTSRLQSQRQVEPVDPLKQQRATQSPGLRPMQPGGVVFQKPPLTPQVRPRPPFQATSSVQEGGQQGVIPSTPVVPSAELGERVSIPSRPSPMSRPPIGARTNSFAPPSAPPKPGSGQRMSRKRLVIVLALLFVLIVSGMVTWIIAAKPFAVASITQPWQQFCDSGLGVSGQYPTGWTKQVDKNQGVHFSDDTDQFSLVSAAANGQDAGTFLKKEASQLGITGLKLGTPASFAGTSWQQAQGSLLSSQTGVTYTETLLVTMHSNRFFTIRQVAPPSTYNEEDATNFSGMRSSFQFSNNCP